MNFLRKVVFAASLSGCVGSALASNTTPTLGDVLKASGIDVTGYIDVSHNSLSTDVNTFNGRAFDTEKRGFNLQSVDVAVSHLPAKGVGGFVQIDYGSDAKVISSAGTNATDDVEVQEAYLQYADGPFSLLGGKFATLAGAEVIESPSNVNFSRSFMFLYAIPFTHTGVRANFAPSDTVKFIVGMNNGWDVMKESQQTAAANGQRAMGKTLELGVSATPSKMLSLAAVYYSGKESGGTTIPADRNLLDIVATFNLSDALSFVLNYDKGEQDKVGGTTAKWDGLAGYANLKLSDTWRTSLRMESFKDKNCYRTGCAFTSQTLKEVTLTLAHMPSKHVELRAEIRKDKSNQLVFREGGSTKKSQNSLGLEAIYKF